MNETLQIFSAHRSIRHYKPKALSPETIAALVFAAQRAPSSNYKQAYSIIGIDEPALKSELAAIAQQDYVAACPYLFVFVADLSRFWTLGGEALTPALDTAEEYTVAVVDTALAAQNLVIAAESLGLGTCYIGALRNDIARVGALLHLPRYSFPLFGLMVGEPDETRAPKPRLPATVVFHHNRYQAPALPEALVDYEHAVRAFYQDREDAKSWQEQTLAALQRHARETLKTALEQQGLLKR